jgi:hypothetical protein
MFNIRLIGIFASLCFVSESIGKNLNKLNISEVLGKQVFVYRLIDEYGMCCEKTTYTSELSRLLLEGGNIFFNRFDSFIKNVEIYSLSILKEAIEDALLLSPYEYNTNSYSASKLLNFLSDGLQNKIAYIKEQIKHDYKWDPKNLSSLKKTAALAICLKTLDAVIDRNDLSKLDDLRTIVSLALLPVSYQILKNCYKLLTIRPNDSNQYLDKYEELFAFVQKLKAELDKNKFITIELNSGLVASLKDDLLTVF